MTAAVLDASALLALVLDEPGGEKVRTVLTECAMTTVNFGKVVGHFARIGSPEAEIRLMLEPLPFLCVALDGELAFAAGLILPATRPAGLSFGDRACLALANRLNVPALTADRAWRGVARTIGVEIELIRGETH